MKSKNLQNIFGKVTAVVVSMTLLLSAVPVRAASEGTGETLAASNGSAVQYDSIDGLSGDILYDTEGQPVAACGGEVHQVVENGKTKWYWFGEGVPTGTPTGTTAYSVHLYSSTDLYNWTKEEDMFRGMSSKDQFETDDYFKALYGDLNEAQKTEAYELLSSCFTAHLKMLYNEKEKQYVIWGPVMSGPSGVTKAFIATSKSIKGPFKFIKYCEGAAKFITLFQDADGTAYAVCQGTGGVSLLKLSEDYMDLQGAQQSVSFSMSEGSMFQRNGKYYLLNTIASTYAVADSLDGPWTQHTFQINTDEGLINTSTYSTNPTACVLPVETKDGVIYIHMTEKWDTSGQGIARYVWLPIEFQENGEITLKGLENWTLELKEEEEPEPVEVTAVKLSETQKTLKIGEEYQINASVEPSNATDKTLTYTSGNDKAATVSETGLVKALTSGSTEITVRSANGMTATLQITVEDTGKYASIYGLEEKALYDTEGQPVAAYGGEVHQVIENGTKKWYWFGENIPRSTPTETTARSVNLYSSTDLYNWTKEEDIFRRMSSKDQFETDDYFKELYGDLNEAQKTEVYELLSGGFTSQLKMLYNEKEKQYVIWGPVVGPSGVTKAFIATSKSIKGPFKFIKYCEGAAKFMTLFQDADGTAYAVCQGTGGVSLLKLSEDYMDLQGAQKSVSFFMNEGSMFQRNGKYYLLSTQMSNYAVADSLDGPWTEHPFQIDTDEGPVITNSCGMSPTSCILPVETKDGVIYIHMTEKSDGAGQGTARYVWLPIDFQENGEITLKGLKNWTLELQDEPVEVTAVKLSETQKTLKIGEEYQINASVEPSNATDTTLTYTSGNGKAATVSDTGLVKAVAVGSAEITVRSANGKTAALQITVEDTGKYASIYGLEDEALYDTEGQPIAACGGEVHQVIENGTRKWYWFGEDMPKITPTETTTHSVHLYSSTDLYNWTKEEDIFRGMSSKDQFETDDYFKELYGDFNEEQKAEAYEVLSNCFTAHLKVLYNEKEKQYVMWGPVSMETPGVMKTFIATSKSIKGPFKFEKYCDEVAQFVTLFQDADGTAYAVCRGTGGLSLLQLSEDYMDLQGTNHSVVFSMQEGSMFQRNGKYYLLSTQTSKYAVADSLDGPWTEYPFQINSTSDGLINTSEYSINPTACVFLVETKDGVIYIHMTEKWDDLRQEPSRYVWLPIDFQENGKITLKGLKNWTLELKEEPKPLEVTVVKLPESQKTLKVGEEYEINASVEPADATDKTLTYTSGNNQIATVSETGLVKAIAVGSTNITVKSANGKTATLQLTVEAAEKPPVEVTAVELSETQKTLKVGEEYEINASVEPTNATDKTLTYTSGNNQIATVSETGLVKAIAVGSTNITVKSANGKTATLQITVEAAEKPPVEVTEVKLSETKKTLKVGEKYQIEASVKPSNATDKTLTYTSGNNKIATVSETGLVKAKAVGSTKITVKSVNGKKATLQITVKAKKPEVQRVLVSEDKLTVGVSEKVQLEAGVYPKNAGDKKLNYKASNNKVKVNQKGMITAQKTGSCKITISASNGKKAVVKVTVKKKPSKISLNAKKKTLKKGKKFQIKPKLPKGTASYNITYTSNKKSVASVSKTGKVTAKKKGNATITVKTYNGKKAVIKISVK